MKHVCWMWRESSSWREALPAPSFNRASKKPAFKAKRGTKRLDPHSRKIGRAALPACLPTWRTFYVKSDDSCQGNNVPESRRHWSGGRVHQNCWCSKSKQVWNWNGRVGRILPQVPTDKVNTIQTNSCGWWGDASSLNFTEQPISRPLFDSGSLDYRQRHSDSLLRMSMNEKKRDGRRQSWSLHIGLSVTTRVQTCWLIAQCGFAQRDFDLHAAGNN